MVGDAVAAGWLVRGLVGSGHDGLPHTAKRAPEGARLRRIDGGCGYHFCALYQSSMSRRT
jgi:hypothetical protein